MDLKIIEKSVETIMTGQFQEIYIEKEYESSFRERKHYISHKGDYFGLIHEGEQKLTLEEGLKYSPENLFGIDLMEKFNVKNYKTYILPVSEGVELIMHLHKGSISGVGWGNGWEVRIGINFHGLIIKMYAHKFGLGDNCKGWYNTVLMKDEDFIKAIDFDKFVQKDSLKYYVPDYSHFGKATRSEMEKALTPLIKDGTFYITDFLWHFAQDLDHTGKRIFPRDLLEILEIKKLVFQTDNFTFKDHFDVPPTLKSVDFDIKPPAKKESYGRTVKGMVKRVMEDNEDLIKFFPVTFKDTAKKRQENRKLWDLHASSVLIKFSYENVSGVIASDEYAASLLKKHYQEKEAVLDFAGLKVKFKPGEVLKHIKIEKVKNENKFEKAVALLGEKIGYSAWWNKSFEKSPPSLDEKGDWNSDLD
jgi:hypothetical protein